MEGDGWEGTEERKRGREEERRGDVNLLEPIHSTEKR